VVARDVPRRAIATLTFAYRSQRPAARPLLALEANAIRITDDGKGRVVVRRGGRRLARVPRRAGRGGWANVRVKLANGRLAVWVDGRSARLRVRHLKAER